MTLSPNWTRCIGGDGLIGPLFDTLLQSPIISGQYHMRTLKGELLNKLKNNLFLTKLSQQRDGKNAHEEIDPFSHGRFGA